MALMDGKQIRDTSISLNKLNQSGVVAFNLGTTMSFSFGAVLQTDDGNILSGLDVVNKNYVDAVASGLDAKVPVTVVAATGSITLSGANFMIDGFTVSAGDRVLVAAQAGPNVATASNGIYVVDPGPWSRATDSDGTPANEVSHGNFVFVLDGSVYEHTGWVLTITDASNPDQIIVGTDSQGWVQFSEQSNIRAGEGLYYVGQSLNVGAGTGITVSADVVAIADTTVTAAAYGQADSVTTFTVNAQGQLTAAGTQSINILSTQVSDFDTASETAIFETANFLSTSTLTFSVTAGDSVTAEVQLSSLTASRLDIINSGSASGGWKLGYNSTGQFEWFDPSQSDISEVVAGAGLAGGGSGGSVTLQIADTAAGNGLTFSSGVFNVNTANGLTINGDNVEIDSSAAGDGLSFTTGVFTVNTSNGLTIIGGDVQIADTVAGNGLTFSSGVIDVQVNSDSLEITNDQIRLKDTITGDRTFSDSVTINGDFTVNGTVSYISTIDLLVEDNVITLNGTYSGSPIAYSGIEVNVGNGTYSKFLYDSSLNVWTLGVSGSSALTILTTAGAGLTKSSNGEVVDVNTINGLSIIDDSVGLGGTLSQATTINAEAYDFTIQNFDNLSLTGSVVDIQLDNGLFIVDAGDSGSIDLYGGDVTIYATGSVDIVSTMEFTLQTTSASITTTDTLGLRYAADYSGTFVSNSLVSKQYVDNAVSVINGDFITGVTAGAGISGGGTSGFIDISVQLTAAKGLTFSGSGDSGTLEVSLTPVGGLTFSSGGIAPVVDGVTIQVNGSGQLTVTGGATQPNYSQRNQTPNPLTEGVNGQSTGLTMSVTPSDYSYVSVYVNGIMQFLGNGATASGGVDCYFSDDGGTTAKLISNIVAGDTLYWNANLDNTQGAGFALSTTDRVDILFQN